MYMHVCWCGSMHVCAYVWACTYQICIHMRMSKHVPIHMQYVFVYVFAYVRMHSFMRACGYKVFSYIQILYTYTNIHANAHVHRFFSLTVEMIMMHRNKHVYIYACAYIRTYTNVVHLSSSAVRWLRLTELYIHTCTYMYIYTYRYMYTHVYTHTHIRIYMHTHTYIYCVPFISAVLFQWFHAISH
jgi:hypothetical protein